MENGGSARDTAWAMSEENVEIVRSSILGFNERGVDAFVEHVAPDVEFHPPKESFEPGIYRGPDGVRTYWERIGETFEERRVESVDMIEVDDTRVIAVVKAFVKTPHFEGEVEMNWAWLYTMRDGLVTHVVGFTDRAQALEAARLSE
jgi:ketosteroid isomerase-like protein